MASDMLTMQLAREIDQLKAALAEKDLFWKRRVGLDCGDHSCFFAIEKKGMRTNGGCRCKPKQLKEDHDRLYEQYASLLKQAVRFAEGLGYLSNDVAYEAAIFLATPEAQAMRKGE